jgi:hypothetical protein
MILSHRAQKKGTTRLSLVTTTTTTTTTTATVTTTVTTTGIVATAHGCLVIQKTHGDAFDQFVEIPSQRIKRQSRQRGNV